MYSPDSRLNFKVEDAVHTVEPLVVIGGEAMKTDELRLKTVGCVHTDDRPRLGLERGEQMFLNRLRLHQPSELGAELLLKESRLEERVHDHLLDGGSDLSELFRDDAAAQGRLIHTTRIRFDLRLNRGKNTSFLLVV